MAGQKEILLSRLRGGLDLSTWQQIRLTMLLAVPAILSQLSMCLMGTQPLCYARDLILEDCTFGPDADLAFEYSSVRATILSDVTSVKNPLTGSISARSFGEIIIDGNLKAPGDCEISVIC